MAKRIQDFRNFNSSKDVTTSTLKKSEVANNPKKQMNYEASFERQKVRQNSPKVKNNFVSESKEKKNTKSNKFIVIFFILLIITGVAVGCLFSPTFNLTGVIVNDGVNVTSEEILNSFTVITGTNIFKINRDDVKKSIEKLPYIKSAEVKFELPSEIKIEYEEREPFTLIKYLESYMVMDKFGYILEITRENKFEDLPIIYNIDFDSYEIGKQLEDTAKTKYDNVIYLLENAVQSNFSYKISEINYESIGNVRIWVKEAEIEIIYGEIDRNIIGDKLSYIEEILNRTKGKKGKLDISSLDYLEGKMVFTERF